ncbi:hypothetical protein EYF80_066113 [Liparis tanakae]|uniref:Uncharacterized protein n=1 Tax=Liparis tanakae TaxID=230148 RepID=A0A4Z2E4M3_9TELE|nr:hypothetical protein EYF80_066113 [Liparis tanakae]
MNNKEQSSETGSDLEKPYEWRPATAACGAPLLKFPDSPRHQIRWSDFITGESRLGPGGGTDAAKAETALQR